MIEKANHTHVGYRPHVGAVHAGSRLHGHRLPNPGKRHALTGGPASFVSACGESVVLRRRFDDYGEEVAPNVVPVADANLVTCKRCLRAMGG